VVNLGSGLKTSATLNWTGFTGNIEIIQNVALIRSSISRTGGEDIRQYYRRTTKSDDPIPGSEFRDTSERCYEGRFGDSATEWSALEFVG
jgi:hypothetical protein